MSALPARRPLASDGGRPRAAPRRPSKTQTGDAERRCFATRETHPKSRMVRFVVDPDGGIVVDVAGRLPGRGLWLQARSDIVARALSRSLFGRAAKRDVRVPADLVQRVETQLAARCLAHLGMARRAGQAVAGWQRVTASLDAGTAAVALVAGDGAPGSRDKLRQRARGVPIIALFSADELGQVFDRDRVVHVAVFQGGLARLLIEDSDRLAGFRSAESELKLD